MSDHETLVQMLIDHQDFGFLFGPDDFLSLSQAGKSILQAGRSSSAVCLSSYGRISSDGVMTNRDRPVSTPDIRVGCLSSRAVISLPLLSLGLSGPD